MALSSTSSSVSSSEEEEDSLSEGSGTTAGLALGFTPLLGGTTMGFGGYSLTADAMVDIGLAVPDGTTIGLTILSSALASVVGPA